MVRTKTVVDGETGLFFHDQSVDALIDTIHHFESSADGFAPEVLTAHAAEFDRCQFERRFLEFLRRAKAGKPE